MAFRIIYGLGVSSWTQLRMRSWSAGPMPIPKADCKFVKTGALIALFLKAEYRLNRAELEEACLRQFCRAHSWHSESYMAWGYRSWTYVRMQSWSAAQCQYQKQTMSDFWRWSLIALFLKPDNDSTRAELEEACLWQFCRAHSWHSEWYTYMVLGYWGLKHTRMQSWSAANTKSKDMSVLKMELDCIIF
jgi:hypothetical protein